MSERGYLSAEILGCQFAVYPLRQPDIDGPVQAAIQAAGAAGCSVRVGNLSTLISGSEDQVFAALRAAFRAAQRHGPAVMTATLAAGMPADELVGEIQRDLDARGEAPPGAALGDDSSPSSNVPPGSGGAAGSSGASPGGSGASTRTEI